MAGEITVTETVVQVNATVSPVVLTVTQNPVTVTTTNQGVQGNTGATGPKGNTGDIGVAFSGTAPSNHDQLWADTSTSSAQVAVFDGGTPAAQLTSIKTRRGTSSTWFTANPILDAGEFGFESNTRKFKIGDGSTRWNSLGYALALADYNNPTFTGTITMTGATVVDGTISGGSA